MCPKSEGFENAVRLFHRLLFFFFLTRTHVQSHSVIFNKRLRDAAAPLIPLSLEWSDWAHSVNSFVCLCVFFVCTYCVFTLSLTCCFPIITPSFSSCRPLLIMLLFFSLMLFSPTLFNQSSTFCFVMFVYLQFSFSRTWTCTLGRT